MTPRRRANFLRLLKPRHIAVVGGRDAEVVAGECVRIGYDGPFWPINPKREKIGGHRCYATVDDLPEPPDAVFLAIPREPAIETLAKLDALGAGGVVCYTAGFGEIGDDGAAAEAALIEAAGDLALIGPNCYGLINYIDKVALWPFAHGGDCPGYGAAIITQSGMLSSDLSMNQRSVPLTYMISAGNQTILHLGDFIDLLCDRQEVRAIGLHIEGLKDIASFEQAALKALRQNVPIVALKTGKSAIGTELTVSHTGSISGADDLYNALFERLGVIRVTSPVQLLETLKWICIAGPAKGNRIAALTCSGGGATMLADHAEDVGLDFSKPSEAATEKLKLHLPFTATVSNPLDYTTPIWGMPEKTGPVFTSFLSDDYDAAILVQDYPPRGLDESTPFYLKDAKAFIEAATARDIPAAICSTLPENMDAETRRTLISTGAAPMQGLHEALNAIAGSAWYTDRRSVILDDTPSALSPGSGISGPFGVVDEALAKQRLSEAGLTIPEYRITNAADAPVAYLSLGGAVVLKMLSPKLPHKTEAGAVRLQLESAETVAAAVKQMQRDVAAYNESAVTGRFLIEKMVGPPIAELMVGLRRDPQFGYAMTLASGGILIELIGDAATVLLPATQAELEAALDRLRIARLLDGYRGKPAADRPAIIDALILLANCVIASGGEIAELEINPLFVFENGVCAIDVLMRNASRS
ncbi:MAG: acetate--CoA ligase family protein [Geminicoccaceae bacterium]